MCCNILGTPCIFLSLGVNVTVGNSLLAMAVVGVLNASHESERRPSGQDGPDIFHGKSARV